MKFYHGTSEIAWKKIQEEGILFGGDGYHNRNDKKCYRYTYLTPEIAYAEDYGDVILEVNYDPVGIDGTGTDNYGFDPPEGEICWQFSVFIPILINKVKRIDND